MEQARQNAPGTVLLASVIGSTIEFFDFYIYATAAVLIFPRLFFPASDPTSSALASLATFGIAFLARPIGSALFGHLGDRIGRKRSLVMTLLTMGLCTVAIGLLPGYNSIGVAAPLLLAVLRFGQGIGLGGEWSGAVLLAVENAPPGKRAWFGMFPQLGAPFGFLLSGGFYLLLSNRLTPEQFFSFGWRLPFLASGCLLAVGMYVRLHLVEAEVFQSSRSRGELVTLPLKTLLTQQSKPLIAGTVSCLATFVLFYLITVFTMYWATSALGQPRSRFLGMQLISVLFFAAAIPVSALLAEHGRKRLMLTVTVAIALFGLGFGTLLGLGSNGLLAMMIIGQTLMGITYAPLGTLLSELFPTNVRYTGSALAFSLSAILGASCAPYIAVDLAKRFGIASVGYYLTGSAVLTLGGLLAIRETKTSSLSAAEPVTLTPPA